MERRSKTRATLACLPCRNQHLKCDGTRPICSRCQGLSRTCAFSESRRSGSYKAALRRTRAQDFQAHNLTPTDSLASLGSELQQPLSDSLAGFGVIETQHDDGIEFVDLYYENFHPSHPFILPRTALDARYAAGCPNIQHVMGAVRHIGSFYTSNPIIGIEDSLLGQVEHIDGFIVQTTLLTALAKSMCAEQDLADELLSKAMHQASLIGMGTKTLTEFTSQSDPVLAESLRRTMWMLYVSDANFAVIRQDYTLRLKDMSLDVDLPCEDKEYNEMLIPPTRTTLAEYHSREYDMQEKSFSSFSYYIDASVIFATTLHASLKFMTTPKAEMMCDDLEAKIAGWFTMLPPSKRDLDVRPAFFDQLIFQAHMMMYTCLAYIHRPFSTLRYDPIESISSCGSPPPPLFLGVSGGSGLNRQSHLQKLLQAIRKQNQCLIILPLGPAQLSPFVICMVACCTIAHLVACKSTLPEDEAEVARSRIRVCLGTLRHYEDIWPRAKKILLELKRIANSILQTEMATVQYQPAYSEVSVAQQDNTLEDLFEEEWLDALRDLT
ncbi:uncharacterized protein FSUBG_6902 [Fusarium subglutinans]|uniref:Zn(2)-C6 fungal-type domain-containing protein n=1 Tax=Gibberella subglutinans TaxID=42677 RepID=A0A8H5V0Q0_GIBSU|nr:uncharacterized protein FSUBG_6902 [Fusarium subglutinans]KAF5604129.1 hypothetical protein FSUBG_6902 [Fusarium subglutinans]